VDKVHKDQLVDKVLKGLKVVEEVLVVKEHKVLQDQPDQQVLQVSKELKGQGVVKEHKAQQEQLVRKVPKVLKVQLDLQVHLGEQELKVHKGQ
jgi:hypothetical protein